MHAQAGMRARVSTYRRVFAMVLELGEPLVRDVLGGHGDLLAVLVLVLFCSVLVPVMLTRPGPSHLLIVAAPRWAGFYPGEQRLR